MVLAFCLAGTASATTPVYVDDDCDTSSDGTEFNPYCTIADGILNVDADGTVNVAAGTYDESILIDGKNVSLIADESVLIQPTTACGLHKDVIQIYNSVATVEGFIINANYSVSGCLGGIYARGMPSFNPGEGPADVTVVNNSIYNYGKNGITVNGELATAIIKGNTVTGRGPLPLGDYAQNGIQFGWGASGEASGNTISNHSYTDPSWIATGLLLYDVHP